MQNLEINIRKANRKDLSVIYNIFYERCMWLKEKN